MQLHTYTSHQKYLGSPKSANIDSVISPKVLNFLSEIALTSSIYVDVELHITVVPIDIFNALIN